MTPLSSFFSCCPVVLFSGLASGLRRRASSSGRLPSSLFFGPVSGLRRRVSSLDCRPASGGLRAAFTLIELLVVMVVAAIIMSIALPAFTSMGRGVSLRTAVANVRSTLALSRQWAITHREPITFVWSNSPDPNALSYYCANNVTGTLVQSITELPVNVSFDVSSDTNLTFKTDGGLTVGCITEHIILIDKQNNKQTIAVNGLTGGIQVQ